MIFLEKPDDFKPELEIVSCFLEHDGKILLLHRQDHKPQGNTWGVPAGKIDLGESKDEAMRRELFEETGVTAKEKKSVWERTVYVRYPEYDFVYHIYRLTLNEFPSVMIDDRAHKSYVWITPEESLAMNLIRDLDACVKLSFGL